MSATDDRSLHRYNVREDVVVKFVASRLDTVFTHRFDDDGNFSELSDTTDEDEESLYASSSVNYRVANRSGFIDDAAAEAEPEDEEY